MKVNKENQSKTFPWWCLFIAYGISLFLILLSILLIIARGIEFGDLKSQKWLTSILTGFFSSIFLTQPLKVICLAIFFAFFFRNSNDDKEAKEFLDETSIELKHDEEYLHTTKVYSSARDNRLRGNRLTKEELEFARFQRLRDIQMWSVVREALTYLIFFVLLCFIVYPNRNENSYYQVRHFQKFFSIGRSFKTISTVDDYWNWLEKNFIRNLRAQKWYNDQQPRDLSGYMNDKTNRLIGWATMRQLRVKSIRCPDQQIILDCQDDYSFLNEEKGSFHPKWSTIQEEEYSPSMLKAFRYQSDADTYIYVGEHETYNAGGYIYEFRGSLSDLRSNISELHQLGWIDDKTRGIIIQITLYNPNVQLFTSVTLLLEFLSTSGISPQVRFEPMNFLS